MPATVVERSALVPHSNEQMFALVADVNAYAEFLPWCRRSTVLSASETEMKARLEVAKGPFAKSFTTRNGLHPHQRITIDLVEGPFRRLHGEWLFESRGGEGCKVSLSLRFEFTSRIMSATLGPVFNEIAGTMVGAFSRRASTVYEQQAGGERA